MGVFEVNLQDIPTVHRVTRVSSGPQRDERNLFWVTSAACVWLSLAVPRPAVCVPAPPESALPQHPPGTQSLGLLHQRSAENCLRAPSLQESPTRSAQKSLWGDGLGPTPPVYPQLFPFCAVIETALLEQFPPAPLPCPLGLPLWKKGKATRKTRGDRG